MGGEGRERCVFPNGSQRSGSGSPDPFALPTSLFAPKEQITWHPRSEEEQEKGIHSFFPRRRRGEKGGFIRR